MKAAYEYYKLTAQASHKVAVTMGTLNTGSPAHISIKSQAPRPKRSVSDVPAQERALLSLINSGKLHSMIATHASVAAR